MRCLAHIRNASLSENFRKNVNVQATCIVIGYWRCRIFLKNFSALAITTAFQWCWRQGHWHRHRALVPGQVSSWFCRKEKCHKCSWEFSFILIAINVHSNEHVQSWLTLSRCLYAWYLSLLLKDMNGSFLSLKWALPIHSFQTRGSPRRRGKPGGVSTSYCENLELQSKESLKWRQ